MTVVYISEATLKMLKEKGQACLTHISTKADEHMKVRLDVAEAPEVTASKFMVAARNAQMLRDVRSIVASCADPKARTPYRHVEAQRLLPLLDAFLGPGYTGNVVRIKEIDAALKQSGSRE